MHDSGVATAPGPDWRAAGKVRLWHQQSAMLAPSAMEHRFGLPQAGQMFGAGFVTADIGL